MNRFSLLGLLGLCLLAASAGADVSMNLYAPGATTHDPVLALDTGTDSAGQYFQSTISFNRVTVHVFNYGTGGRGFTMRLYPWVSNYATSVAQPVVAQQVFANIPDNADISMDFATPAPAGSYLLVISNQTGGVCGIYCYNNSGFNNAYAFENGVPAETVYNNNAANYPASNEPHNFGQRFALPHCEYANLRYFVYTYSTNPGKAYTTYLYNWNTNYANSVAGAPVLTQSFPGGVADNSNHTFALGARSAGIYLMRLEAVAPTPTNMGWWRHDGVNNYPSGAAYLDGNTAAGGYNGILSLNSRDFNGYVTKLTPAKPGTPDLAAVDDAGSSNSDNRTNQTSGLSLSGTAEPNSSITIRNGAATIGTTSANSGGVWAADIALAAGSHSITVTATDNQTQVSPASDPLVIIVDTTGTSVSTVDVVSGLVVDVTFSEAMGTGATTAANYTITLAGKGSLANNPNSVVAQGGNTYRLTWASGEMLNGGNVRITVTGAQDVAGNAMGSPNNATDTGGGIGVAPSVICPGSASVTMDPGICTGTVPNVIAGLGTGDVNDNITSDANLLASLQQTPVAGTPGVGDGQVITVTVTDDAGNTGQCTVSLSVVDDEDPLVNCPASASVNTGPGVCTGTVPDVLAAITAADVSDNCTADGALLALLQQSPAAGTPGAADGQIITVTVTDSTGNTGECTVTLSVTDDEDPVLNCPANVSVSADAGVCTGTVPNVLSGLTAANVQDNCTADGILLASLQQSPAAGTPGVSNGQLITVTATDDAGNTGQCTVTLNVVDDEDPTVSCPGSASVNANPGVCTGTVPNVLSGITAASVNDNCTADGALLASLQQSPAAGTAGASNGQVITVTVTDGAGNTGQCTVTLTVLDTQNPVVNCPSSPVVPSDAGVCTGTVPNVISALGATNVSDNCTADGALLASLQQSPAAGTTGAANGQLITITATDAAGNPGQCTVALQVVDMEDPVLNCGASVTVNTNPGVCTGTAPNVAGLATGANVSDNCTSDGVLLASIQQSPAAGTPGVNDGDPITVTITDSAGNTGQCVITITVVDNEDPIVTPNAGATASATLNVPFTDPGATASDNCGVQGGTAIASGNCIAGDCTFDTSIAGNTWTIEYSATDINGNGPVTASTVFTVAADTTDPEFTNIVAVPDEAMAGDTVTITFTASEDLQDDPEVMVNGNHADYVAQSPAKAAIDYIYEYTITPADPLGPAEIIISGTDLAGNLGAVSSTSALTIITPAAGLPLSAWPLIIALAVGGAALIRRRR